MTSTFVFSPNGLIKPTHAKDFDGWCRSRITILSGPFKDEPGDFSCFFFSLFF